MHRITATRYFSAIERTTQLHVYGAIRDLLPEHSEDDREVNANIELLRSEAPYAYLIANGLRTPVGNWREGKDRAYYDALPAMPLRRGGWFANPDFNEPTETLLLAAGRASVLPYVWTLHMDWHQILCLPTPETLEAIDEKVYTSESTAAALTTLLANGGFVVSCIDFVVFKILTSDTRYKAFFSAA